jgi:histidine triad (HIT) family protein
MSDTLECIFCKIVREELPKFTLYEDESYLAFLDVFPRVKGHALVIPKDHHRWVYDVPDFGAYWEVAKTVGEKLQQSLGSECITYVTMGNEVPHAHIHILPQQTNKVEGFTLSSVVDMSKDEMAKLALEITNAK